MMIMMGDASIGTISSCFYNQANSVVRSISCIMQWDVVMGCLLLGIRTMSPMWRVVATWYVQTAHVTYTDMKNYAIALYCLHSLLNVRWRKLLLVPHPA